MISPTVGFTNGVFDLLHEGHVYLLTEARKHCDWLIVGLNTDASVKKLKGPDRPIEPWSVREANLRGTGLVDLVYPFNSDDQLRMLIKHNDTDILFKGNEYEGKDIIGKECAKFVMLMPMLPGFSTSAKIRGRLH